MAIREVVLLGDPMLRRKAKKVKKFNQELRQLADDMLETMRNSYGIGLAGPQIGILERIFVAEVPDDVDDPNKGKHFVIVNPRIIKRSKEMEEGQEGCLSIPSHGGMVNRPKEIEMMAMNVYGKKIRMKKVGNLLARIFQHEYDHLNGVLFIDHIDDLQDVNKFWKIVEEDEEENNEQMTMNELQ
ncbi:MAG: peptide deformylase [Anaerolineaceae bacterium 4572_78]|nr:MAG: peptide deformylase [Anaerolineaceae bacterium 4572_78]